MIQRKYQRQVLEALYLSFDESKHPRGQPKNKGEFVAKKGGNDKSISEGRKYRLGGGGALGHTIISMITGGLSSPLSFHHISKRYKEANRKEKIETLNLIKEKLGEGASKNFERKLYKMGVSGGLGHTVGALFTLGWATPVSALHIASKYEQNKDKMRAAVKAINSGVKDLSGI